MLRRAAVFMLALTFANVAPVFAHENDGARATAPATAAADPAAPVAPITLQRLAQTPKRPFALTTLYGTYATLQALDIVSTQKAIAAGGRERNPIMAAGNVGRMVAVKAATGAMTIYFAEKAWKKNRVGGVLLMAALNGATAAIVAHNTQIAKR